MTDGTFGYFGTATSPGQVVKVRLSDMTRVSAVTLDPGEDGLLSAVTDGTFGYFGTNTFPGRVVKVRLADMTRVDAVTLNNGEVFLRSAVTDGTFGYFGTNTSPGRVVKVRLSDMTRVGAVTLNTDENSLLSAVGDGTFGYFGTDTSPGRVVRVRLSPIVPEAPANVAVAPGVGDMAVSWSPPGGDNRPPVTGYTVTKSPQVMQRAQLLRRQHHVWCPGVVADRPLPGHGGGGSTIWGHRCPSKLLRITTPSAELQPVRSLPMSRRISFRAGHVHATETAGITEGTNQPATSAHRKRPVNRQQMALFLWRMAGSPDLGTIAVRLRRPEASIAESARVAACWLKAQDITTNNPYNPTGIVNRQQMAAFLWRFAGSGPEAARPDCADSATRTASPNSPRCRPAGSRQPTSPPTTPTTQPATSPEPKWQHSCTDWVPSWTCGYASTTERDLTGALPERSVGDDVPCRQCILGSASSKLALSRTSGVG